MSGNHMSIFKRLTSFTLALTICGSCLPMSALAEGGGSTPVTLPTIEVAQEVRESDSFYFSTQTAELPENGSGPYLVSVERGGNTAAAADLDVRILDITAKYGIDYTIKVQGAGLLSNEKVEVPQDNPSVLEQIIDNGDSLQETNTTDEVLAGLQANQKQATAETATGETAMPLVEAAATPSPTPSPEPVKQATAETATAESAVLATEALTPQQAKELYTGEDSDREAMDGGKTAEELADSLFGEYTDMLGGATMALHFGAGESEKILEIYPKNNEDGDGNRTFELELNSASEGMSVSQDYSTLILQLIDDEIQEPASVYLSAAEYSDTDGYIEVNILREGALNQTVGVTLATADDTAQKGRDYSQVATSVVFPYGITTRTIKIPISKQALTGEASFNITLSDPVGCNVMGQADAICHIATASFEADYEESVELYNAATANANSTLLASALDLDGCDYASSVWHNGTSAYRNDAWVLAPTNKKYDDDRAIVYFALGSKHYDYIGMQLRWQLDSGKPCWPSTSLEYFTSDTATGDYSWKNIFSTGTGTERWGQEDKNFFFNGVGIRDLYFHLNRAGAFFSKNPTLYIKSIKPILRPFDVTLATAPDLKFLSADGTYVSNRSIADATGDLREATAVTLNGADKEGTGTATKFSGDEITLSTKSKYAYIKSVRIVSATDSSAYTEVLSNLAYGTKSATFKLDNAFITKYLNYVDFSDFTRSDHNKVKAGAFKVQAVMGYYDTSITFEDSAIGTVHDATQDSVPTTVPISYSIRVPRQYDSYLATVQSFTMYKPELGWFPKMLGFVPRATHFTLQPSYGGYQFVEINNFFIKFTKNYATIATKQAEATDLSLYKTATVGRLAIGALTDGHYSLLNPDDTEALAFADNVENGFGWELEAVIPDGTYQLSTTDSGLYLSAASSSPASGTRVSQQTIVGGSKAASWHFERQKDGTYRIYNGNGRALDIKGASTSPGAIAQVYDNNNSVAQRFRILRSGTDQESFIIVSANCNLALSTNGNQKAGAPFTLQDRAKATQWKVSAVITYHKGDTIRVSGAVQDAYRANYITNEVGYTYKLNDNTADVTEARTFKDGKDYIDYFLNGTSVTFRPASVEKTNEVTIRIKTSELNQFNLEEGTLKGKTGISSGEYTVFTVTDKDSISQNSYYRYSIATTDSSKIPVWSKAADKSDKREFAQSTFYYQARDRRMDNILNVTAVPIDGNYALTGVTKYTDTSIMGTSSGTNLIPASGASVEVGSYGMVSGENGILSEETPIPGANGYYVRFRLTSGSQMSHKDIRLHQNNAGTITITVDSGKVDNNGNAILVKQETPAYKVKLGTLVVPSQDQALPHLTGAYETNSTTTVYINDDASTLNATVFNPGATYTAADGTIKTERVTGVEFYAYNSQTNVQRSMLGTATRSAPDDGGYSYWALSTTFLQKETTKYLSSDRIYARVITDRPIGNGTTTDIAGKTISPASLQSTAYPLIFTDLTFSTENEKEPVTQDIDLPTSANFMTLPLIGTMAASFDLKYISLSVTPLQDGGQRISVGAMPKSWGANDSSHNFDGTADNSKTYKLSDFKELTKDLKKMGMDSGTKSEMLGSTWGIYPTFGLYMDFGIRDLGGANSSTTSTAKDFVFSGGGLYIGAFGNFRLTTYMTVGVTPVYFGVDGAIGTFVNGGFALNSEDTKTLSSIKNTSGTLSSILKPQFTLEANAQVSAFVGAGLCGTLGVRGGLTGTMNYLYNPTLHLKNTGIDENGVILDLSLFVKVDALLFTIPAASYKCAGAKYGYFKDIETNTAATNSYNSSGSEGVAGETATMRARTQGTAVWYGTDAAQTMNSAGNQETQENQIQNYMSSLTAGDTKLLLNGGYDHADPQLLPLDDTHTLLVFLNDDANRSDAERTVLQYSVFDRNANMWSAPQSIADDDTADFSPNLCDTGDSIMISWTSRAAGAASTDANDYATTLDIYTVQMDKATQTLGSVERLCKDAFYDSDPVGLYDATTGDRIVYYLKSAIDPQSDYIENVSPTKNHSVLVYMLFDAASGEWQRAHYFDNEVSSEEDADVLIKNWGGQRFLSSALDDPDFATPTDPPIIDFDAISYNGLGVYAYTVDADNNVDTNADRELFIQIYNFAEHKTYHTIRITNDNLCDAVPHLVRNGDSTYLFWLQNDSELRYIDVSALVSHGINDDGTMSADYELTSGVVFYANGSLERVPTWGSYRPYVDNSGNLYIIWLQPVTDESGNASQEIFASALIHDQDSGGEALPTCWSEGVQLTNSKRMNDEAAFVVQGDGQLIVVNNQYDMDLNVSGDAINVQMVATTFTESGSVQPIELSYSDDAPLPGETITVSGTVKNTGLKAASGYTANLYECRNNTLGTLIGTVTSDERLLPSASDNLSFDWTVPENIDQLKVVVVVTENGYSNDLRLAGELLNYHAVYDFTNLEVLELDDGFHLNFTVTNQGNHDYDGDGSQVLTAEFNDLYHSGKDILPFYADAMPAISAKSSSTIDILLDVPDEYLTDSYINGILEVRDTQGNALGSYGSYTLVVTQPKLTGTVANETGALTLKVGDEQKLDGQIVEIDGRFTETSVEYYVEDGTIAGVVDNTLTAFTPGETRLIATVTPYGGRQEIILTVVAAEATAPSVTPGPTPAPTNPPGNDTDRVDDSKGTDAKSAVARYIPQTSDAFPISLVVTVALLAFACMLVMWGCKTHNNKERKK